MFSLRFIAFLVKVGLCLGTPMMVCYIVAMVMSPAARHWAMAEPGPTRFPMINEVLAIPARMVGGTEIVVARNNARVDALDRIIAGDDGTARPGTGPARAPVGVTKTERVIAAALPVVDDSPATEPARPPGQAGFVKAAPDLAPGPVAPAAGNREGRGPPKTIEVNLPDGVIVSRAAAAGVPFARAPFFNWVIRLAISGVDQNPPGRILLNGRFAVAGQEMSAALGVTFDHLDLMRRLIVFRDGSGAVVTRSY